MKTKKIPKFKNYAEEAKFWDTHDVTDYLQALEFADVEFMPRHKREQMVTIRMEPRLKQQIEKIARYNGVTLSALTRMWLIEKLRHAAKK